MTYIYSDQPVREEEDREAEIEEAAADRGMLDQNPCRFDCNENMPVCVVLKLVDVKTYLKKVDLQRRIFIVSHL